MEKFKKVCIVCGAEFETDNIKKKLCSIECKKKRNIQNVTIARIKKREKLNPNPTPKKKKRFSSFGEFSTWAKIMLRGIDLNQYKTGEEENASGE